MVESAKIVAVLTCCKWNSCSDRDDHASVKETGMQNYFVHYTR